MQTRKLNKKQSYNILANFRSSIAVAMPIKLSKKISLTAEVGSKNDFLEKTKLLKNVWNLIFTSFLRLVYLFSMTWRNNRDLRQEPATNPLKTLNLKQFLQGNDNFCDWKPALVAAYVSELWWYYM